MLEAPMKREDLKPGDYSAATFMALSDHST
jgi:hypothetical protein